MTTYPKSVIHAGNTMMTFEELREILAMSQEGQVLDSLFCVEYGLEDYNQLWRAHADFYTTDTGQEPDEETLVTSFLEGMIEMSEIEEEDLMKLVGVE